jgi:hypothetical protein
MPDVFRSLPESQLSLSVHAFRWKKHLLSAALEQPLDRVNVLGDENTGHTGCVLSHLLVTLMKLIRFSNRQFRCINALSWAKDGQVLLSGGDDTT